MEQSRYLDSKQKNALERVRQVIDHDAVARGEPGLTHSFVASLATAVDCAGYVVDPIHLMGTSGFAFRIWVESRLLPNAMNGFDWQAILPEAVHRAGFDCTHIHRFEQEIHVEEERRLAAHEGIVQSIDQGVPAIVWDPSDPPMWGLVVGYNDPMQIYRTKAFWGYDMPLAYSRLGRRDVNRLSVILLGEPNEEDDEAVIRSSLESALLHAQGNEGRQLSDIQSGLAAFDIWAELLMPGALAEHELQFSDYYAEMFFSFRCYARDYLRSIAHDNGRLLAAGDAYAMVADELREVYIGFGEQRRPPDARLKELAACVRRAKEAEEEALNNISAYLVSSELT
jgi:hypothetical protein